VLRRFLCVLQLLARLRVLPDEGGRRDGEVRPLS